MNDPSQLLKEVTEIHIFESPSTYDRLTGNKESDSLARFLTMSAIENFGHDIYSVADLHETILKVVADIKSRQSKLGGVFFHFSMHGNEQGIALTSEEFITWKEVADLLLVVMRNLGKIKNFPIPVDMSPIGLSFSTCQGLFAEQINSYVPDNISLYMHLVGPKIQVSWEESLDAFTDFYHKSLNRMEGISESVNSMNRAIGKNAFELRMGKGLFIIE